MHGRVRAALALCALLGCAPAFARDAPRTIVLIGGEKSEGPARHEYPDGIRLLKALLESSPDVKAIGGLRIDAYPGGWPKDPGALDNVSTIVWYFDGLDRHPLLDAARRARFEKAMRGGAGLVALHQSSTVAANDVVIDPARWLGAARVGMEDRVTDKVSLEVATPDHPVARGLVATRYHDELFPTFRFADGGRGVTTLLTGAGAGEGGGFRPLWGAAAPRRGRGRGAPPLRLAALCRPREDRCRHPQRRHISRVVRRDQHGLRLCHRGVLLGRRECGHDSLARAARHALQAGAAAARRNRHRRPLDTGHRPRATAHLRYELRGGQELAGLRPRHRKWRAHCRLARGAR